VNVSLLGLDLHEFLLKLAEGLFLNPRTDAPTVELWRKILDRLEEHRRQQWTTVLLWDDAHEAAPDVLAAISRLAEHDASLEARLTMILTADSRHVARLGERLLDRCALRVDVEPWETEDTIEFLEHAVGCIQKLDDGDQPTSFFSPAAMERLHALSGGIPRRVGQLAQWSLLAGAGMGMEQVDEETVAAAAEELGV
jgi:general secretion pathway protein A